MLFFPTVSAYTLLKYYLSKISVSLSDRKFDKGFRIWPQIRSELRPQYTPPAHGDQHTHTHPHITHTVSPQLSNVHLSSFVVAGRGVAAPVFADTLLPREQTAPTMRRHTAAPPRRPAQALDRRRTVPPSANTHRRDTRCSCRRRARRAAAPPRRRRRSAAKGAQKL